MRLLCWVSAYSLQICGWWGLSLNISVVRCSRLDISYWRAFNTTPLLNSFGLRWVTFYQKPLGQSLFGTHPLHWSLSVLKNMVSQFTLDLISWKILLKTCCLKCLIIQWWAELSDSCRIHPYLNTDPVVKQLTHYIGLYDLNRKWGCFCCFNNLFETSLNV